MNPQNDNEQFGDQDILFRPCPTTGVPLVLMRTAVLETNGFGWTTMYMEDFGELLAAGFLPNLWKLFSNGDVSILEPDSYFSLAEFIMEAGKTQAVEYRDGDPFNLCRHNLKLVRKPEYRLSIVK